MKINKFVLGFVTIGAAATLLVAQDNQRPGGGNRPQAGQGQGVQGGAGGRFGGASGGGQRVMPLVEALDANHDHMIDATEIANASAALKKLDKNGDGKLSPDEFMGQRPGGGGGQGGQGGPGQRGPGQGGQGNGQTQRQRPGADQQ